MNYLLTSVLCLANVQQKHLSKSALNEAEIDFILPNACFQEIQCSMYTVWYSTQKHLFSYKHTTTSIK